MKKVYRASAPSNIALIKYMGKVADGANRPTNASVSWTLPRLRTYVELEPTDGPDSWEPLEAWPTAADEDSVRAEEFGRAQRAAARPAELAPMSLSSGGRARFLSHLATIKSDRGYRGGFKVRSANGFPSDCGLASSASSFAALTTAALDAVGAADLDVAQASDCSRRGSGSSCRSFFAPWGLWNDEGASALELPVKDLSHFAAVVSDSVKAVSSSEAHRRVATSALFAERPGRANARLELLISALEKNAWRRAFEIVWAEFWDMHALFETAERPFGYMAPGSLEALAFARDALWEKRGDGPIVTMDAGANVHFLFRADQADLEAHAARELSRKFRVIGANRA